MQGYIFDLDGTLADTMPAHYQAWVTIARRYGLDFPERRFYELGGVPTHKIAEMLVREAGCSAAPERVARDKEEAFEACLERPGAIARIEPVIAILGERRAEGKVAIASGSLRRVVEKTMRAIDIFDWFTVVVTAEDTERHKPEPDVFLEAARRLELAPAVCTVYEDTDLGIEAARRAGMRWVDVRPLYLA